MCANWYVITGAPSSGKTTVINELAKLGFAVVQEAARTFIEQEMKKGKSLEEIRKNEMDFQKKILEIKIDTEKNIPADKIIFFDRGLPDSIAYYQLYGVEPAELFGLCSVKKYNLVFFLEALPYEKDHARIEDEEQIKKLNELLYKAYADLGYKIVRVPVLPVEERTKFILSFIG